MRIFSIARRAHIVAKFTQQASKIDQVYPTTLAPSSGTIAVFEGQRSAYNGKFVVMENRTF